MEILDNLQENKNVEYAGFWIRFVAYLIDTFVALAVIGPIFVMFFAPAEGFSSLAGDTDAMLLYYTSLVGLGLANNIMHVLYFSLMESSKYQATLGKMAVGIVVVGEDGNKISFGRAIGRYFSKIISGIILMIGYIMAGLDSRKQALHDKIASTFVVYKNED